MQNIYSPDGYLNDKLMKPSTALVLFYLFLKSFNKIVYNYIHRIAFYNTWQADDSTTFVVKRGVQKRRNLVHWWYNYPNSPQLTSSIHLISLYLFTTGASLLLRLALLWSCAGLIYCFPASQYHLTFGLVVLLYFIYLFKLLLLQKKWACLQLGLLRTFRHKTACT